jgi:hypothetical protein
MKKALLITSGVLILLVGICTWVYLLLYGTPKSAADVFGNFSFGGESVNDDSYIPPVVTPAATQDPLSKEALRQLTTRPVAGAVLLPGTIRYVERGTGHIYEIDFPGEEKIISHTTIPQTVEAIFSSDGEHVVITAERGEKNELIVGTLSSTDTSTLLGTTLPSGASDIGWNEEGTALYYLLPTPEGSQGYAYDLLKKQSTKLFILPLRDVVVLWGTPIYIYTTPSARQTGYVYTIEKGTLEYATLGSRGLMALRTKSDLVISGTRDNDIVSAHRDGNELLPLPLYPEKCVVAKEKPDSLYCGAALKHDDGEYPDDWYKGERSYSDSLWEVEPEKGETTLLSNMLNESGREIDVAGIGTDPTGSYIYLINKNDGTLWLFDQTI